MVGELISACFDFPACFEANPERKSAPRVCLYVDGDKTQRSRQTSFVYIQVEGTADQCHLQGNTTLLPSSSNNAQRGK